MRLRHVTTAFFDLDLHVELAVAGHVRDDVVRVEDFNIVSLLDVRTGNSARPLLFQLQRDFVAVMQLHHHTFEIQQNIDHVFLHAFYGGVFMQDTGDFHFGWCVAGHGGQQYTAQGIAQRMAIAALERLHHYFCVCRGNILHIDDARLQKSRGIALH